MPLTEIISTTDPKSSEKAASILNNGGVIVYPTETLYGIGALASRSDAVERIFEIKGRPQGKPIPLLVKDMEMLSQIAENSRIASTLSERFWPGRLTLILKQVCHLNELTTCHVYRQNRRCSSRQ